MKKVLFILLVSASFCASSQDIKELDKKYGFRDLRFEDSISLHPTLKAFETTKDSLFTFYRKTDENFRIGGANVDIVYTFFKGRLSSIYIETHDSLGSRKVLKSFQDLYGPGKKEDPYLEKYMWYGREVMMGYYEDVSSFTAKIYISSVKMRLKFEGRDKY